MNRLSKQRTAFFFGLLGAWCLWLPAVNFANEVAAGLLVLRNGNIIEGKVTRDGEHFQVEVEHGRMQVRVGQVEMFCLTHAEAYERRREMRTGSTADSHLELAKWCLRHDLLDYASQEILEARAVDPHHRHLLRLERQLNQAMAQRSKVPKLPQSEKVITAAQEADLSTIDQAPPWARTMFVKRIQPMLVKSCVATGCHQQGSASRLQLNRHAVFGAGHPEATKHNLASVLEQIDFESAKDSLIIRKAELKHGAGASKPLLPHQLEILRAWVEQLAMADAKETQVVQASAVETRHSSVARLGEVYRHRRKVIELATEAHTGSQQEDDPFDPEVFNRQYSSGEGTKR